ncbi:ABC transporter ATP-binding protein [Pseudonocardia xishanensis]|uniref:ABC transporter ATP-binding protein n=1 Tax=Pseudonocardia xishanensis TaxID=630995 RepID=A0ABP8RWL0_9PSEU
MTAVLEVSGLVVGYGAVTAVQGVDLVLEAGTVAVVIGANGAGKSSLINAVSGLVPARSGSVRFRGEEILGRPAHTIAAQGVVQVPEGRRIFAPLTVEENLALGAYTTRSAKRRREILDSVYTTFPVLAERRSSVAGLLSGGQQQMVALGRALMADPTVLLLDEPSMGLAPVMVDVVIDAIEEMARAGELSILLVEQNAAAALSVASHAYVVENGLVVLSGPVAEIRDDPAVARAFLGLDTEATNG